MADGLTEFRKHVDGRIAELADQHGKLSGQVAVQDAKLEHVGDELRLVRKDVRRIQWMLVTGGGVGGVAALLLRFVAP